MSREWTSYLLRRQAEYDAFRDSYEKLIRERRQAFKDWVLGLPMMQWVPLRFRSDKEARFVIGLVCVLYWEKEVNISFSDDMSCIRNEPRTEEETLAWMKATGWHGPGIDKPKNDKAEK